MHTENIQTEYNGHPSWTHWNCSLWAFNDWALYREFLSAARFACIQPDHWPADEREDCAVSELVHAMSWLLGEATPDGAEWTAESLEYVCRDFVSEEMES